MSLWRGKKMPQDTTIHEKLASEKNRMAAIRHRLSRKWQRVKKW
jgi:hypothetical protein